MGATSSPRPRSARSRSAPCNSRTSRTCRCRRSPSPWSPSIRGTSWRSLRPAGSRASAIQKCCGWACPRRAVIALVAGEEIEEQVRMDEIPLFSLAHAEDLAEKLFGLSAAEEMLLIGRALVGIAGRDRYADAEFFGVIEEGRDVFGR